jgi:hypothetical protein
LKKVAKSDVVVSKCIVDVEKSEAAHMAALAAARESQRKEAHEVRVKNVCI